MKTAEKVRFKNKCALRGGSWNYSNTDFLRAHYRFWSDPDGRYDYLGFRCALPEDSPIARRLVRIN